MEQGAFYQHKNRFQTYCMQTPVKVCQKVSVSGGQVIVRYMSNLNEFVPNLASESVRMKITSFKLPLLC